MVIKRTNRKSYFYDVNEPKLNIICFRQYIRRASGNPDALFTLEKQLGTAIIRRGGSLRVCVCRRMLTALLSTANSPRSLFSVVHDLKSIFLLAMFNLS